MDSCDGSGMSFPHTSGLSCSPGVGVGVEMWRLGVTEMIQPSGLDKALGGGGGTVRDKER